MRVLSYSVAATKAVLMDHVSMSSPVSLGIDLATTKGATGICEVDWLNRTAAVRVGPADEC